MKKMNLRVLFLLLAMILLFCTSPVLADAKTPVTIDLSEIGNGASDVSNTYWEYNAENMELTLKADCVYTFTGGVFPYYVSLNGGTIAAGEFSSSVYADDNSIIAGGEYYGYVANDGTILDGTFYSGVDHFGEISGGTFESWLYGSGTVSGGKFLLSFEFIGIAVDGDADKKYYFEYGKPLTLTLKKTLDHFSLPEEITVRENDDSSEEPLSSDAYQYDAATGEITFPALEVNKPFIITAIVVPGPNYTPTFSGKGTQEQPYLISNRADLDEMRILINIDNKKYGDKYYKQTADIVLNEGAFTLNKDNDILWKGSPVSSDNAPKVLSTLVWETPFSGVYDGSGYKISGMYLKDKNNHNGLFGLASGAILRNIQITSSCMELNGSMDNAGFVCSESDTSVIEDCRADGIIKAEKDDIGGICGEGYSSVFRNCCFSGTIIGDDDLGGIGGEIYNSTFESCCNHGDIYGDTDIGGICADTCLDMEGATASLEYCYNTGSLHGTDTIGGICGENTETAISNCYNVGSIFGEEEFGGICGISTEEDGDGPIVITNCYYLDNVENGGGDEASNHDCIKKTAAEIKDAAFVGLLNGEKGKAFFADTLNENQGYPVLRGTATPPYTDVEKGSWYQQDVNYVYHYGLMVGIGGDLFGVNGTTDRAMVVTILYRMAGSPAVTGTNPFSDVEKGLWYTDAVIWAAENNIVAGNGDGTFAPTVPMTREQMARVLYVYAKDYLKLDVSNSADISGFSDAAKVSSWAKDAVTWANAKGLIVGSDNALMPQGKTTRSQAAAILHRFCNLTEEKPVVKDID